MRDSTYEDYFAWWLDELKANGYVEHYEEQLSEQLFSGCSDNGYKMLPTVYTYDFKVTWTEKGCFVFSKFFHIKDSISYVEIKPEYNFKNSTTMTTLKIKWLYDKKGIFVNITKPLPGPKSLFARTFGPSGLPKKFKFNTFNQWLEYVNIAETKSPTKPKSSRKKLNLENAENAPK